MFFDSTMVGFGSDYDGEDLDYEMRDYYSLRNLVEGPGEILGRYKDNYRKLLSADSFFDKAVYGLKRKLLRYRYASSLSNLRAEMGMGKERAEKVQRVYFELLGSSNSGARIPPSARDLILKSQYFSK